MTAGSPPAARDAPGRRAVEPIGSNVIVILQKVYGIVYRRDDDCTAIDAPGDTHDRRAYVYDRIRHTSSYTDDRITTTTLL